jgi:hypothetical protein
MAFVEKRIAPINAIRNPIRLMVCFVAVFCMNQRSNKQLAISNRQELI